MRGNIRGRKNFKHNYKIISIIVLALIFVALAVIFGIKVASKNNTKTEIGNKNEVKQEIIIPEDKTIKLVAIGDIMCHKTNYKAAYDSKTKTYDFSPVFANVAKYISKADIAIR